MSESPNLIGRYHNGRDGHARNAKDPRSFCNPSAIFNSLQVYKALAGRVAFFPYLALSTMMTGQDPQNSTLSYGACTAAAVLLSGLVYPISARLVWGGGWLQQMGFVDFAGHGKGETM